MQKMISLATLSLFLALNSSCAFFKSYMRSQYADSFAQTSERMQQQVNQSEESFETTDQQIKGALKGVTPEMKSLPEFASFQGKYEAVISSTERLRSKREPIDSWVGRVIKEENATANDLTKVQTDYSGLIQAYQQAVVSLNLQSGELERMQNTVRAQKMQQDALKQFKTK